MPTTGGVQANPFVYTLSLADQLTAIQYLQGERLTLLWTRADG